MINSTSSPKRSSSPVGSLASEKWKNISLTTSARSMKPNDSFIEQTTPWYLTGCAGFSNRMWHAPKLPLRAQICFVFFKGEENFLLPLSGGDLEADFVPRSKRDVSLNVVLIIGQKEALAAILVANAAHSFRNALSAKLSGHSPRYPFLTHYLKKLLKRMWANLITYDANNFRRDFRYSARNRLPGPSVVRHLKFNRIANLQMLDIAVKLTEVEKQAGLSFTALDKPI